MWLVTSLVSQRGHRYQLSRTKAVHSFLISAGKKGLKDHFDNHGRVWTWMQELTGACF